MNRIDELSIATIRSLCIDMINKANSGHPGMALGSAPILYTLFTKHLVATTVDSKWINRDRFVLSAGHASALLYAMLHLCGYNVSIDDLASFRQLDSLTPGHPEWNYTDGVDASSGPLGQGIAQAVGMAMAEQAIRANYEHGKELIDHYTYALCGDGCLHEGVAQEAISLAGHQKLNKLILLYDSNAITLDGGLDLSFSENVKNRFIASEWNVLEVLDGNDVNSIDKAISEAKKSKDKPTLIIVHTVIGYGSAKQGTSKVHGSPLGAEDGKHAKVDVYHFDHEDFYVPQEVKEHFVKSFNERSNKIYSKYLKNYEKLKEDYPTEIKRFEDFASFDAHRYVPDVLPNFESGSSISTRAASGKALNDYMLSVPMLFGGSADVASSVVTKINGGTNFEPNNRQGHNINFGIREFAMACAQNGMLLHGGMRTYVGCFAVFSDYMKPAIRMAALQNLPAIYLFSHDSIALGEDGPTHQPIEQLAMLRSIPNVNVIRPCDERETYAAWKYALLCNNKPNALILSRQGLPLIDGSSDDGLKHGAYIISKEAKEAQLILIATGSEVSLAINAQSELAKEDIDVRVVSMPSWEIFEEQDEEYKNSVLSLPLEKRISVEMLSSFGWDKFARHHMSVDTFGASAPGKDVTKKYGFDCQHLVAKCKELLK